MKKFLKNIVFVSVLIVIAMSVFNISYGMLGYGYFYKASTIKDTTVFTKDNNVKYSNINSYKIENKDYNNSAYYKAIKVKKNTPYKISCMIKTENVEILKDNDENSGAKISILNSEEESKSITGTSDWQKISIMFNSKAQEDIQVGFMLGGNSNEGSAKGTVWFSNFQIEEGSLDSNNIWNFACFVFKNTNVNIEETQYTYEMSQNDIEQIKNNMERFKLTCEEFSNGLMSVSYKIIEIDKPITSISYDVENGYYIDAKDVSNQIDSYLDQEEFDHIFVCARLSDEESKIPINDWIGLGSMEYEGIGYSNVRMPTSDKSYAFTYNESANKFPEEVFVHEFLHSLELNSQKYGYECPELHSYETYGYKEEKLTSLYEWYKNYMSCNIKYENETIGLNQEIYKYKPVHESNFKNSIKLAYFDEPTGTIEKLKIMMNTVKSKI